MDEKKKFANNIEKEKQERKCVAMSAELPLSPKYRLTKADHKTRTKLNFHLHHVKIISNMVFFLDTLFR